MGVKAGTYSDWERARDNPRETACHDIIDFLGFDPSEGEQEQELPIAERIREGRESEGVSQRELAERLGIAPSTVKAWEADTISRPTPRVRTIFEDYLKEAKKSVTG